MDILTIPHSKLHFHISDTFQDENSQLKEKVTECEDIMKKNDNLIKDLKETLSQVEKDKLDVELHHVN